MMRLGISQESKTFTVNILAENQENHIGAVFEGQQGMNIVREDGRVSVSFRDASGSVSWRDGAIYRCGHGS